MDNAELFSLASAAVLPGWLALAALPAFSPRGRKYAVSIARIIAAALSGFYIALLITGLAGEGPPPGASFTSLEGVRLLMSSEAALLAGWVHYLAFDLWVGAWETEDARLAHWLLLPCLALTFVAGPTGLLLYLVLRVVRSR